MTSEIFVHARHICIVAKTCLVACQNICLSGNKLFFNVGVLLHAKKLFPFTMQGEQAYAKFKAPIESGLQTIGNKPAMLIAAFQEVLDDFKKLIT